VVSRRSKVASPADRHTPARHEGSERPAGQPNQGCVNAHFINDGKVASEVDAGVPAC